MDPVGSPITTSELQALIAAIPNDISFAPSSVATSQSNSSSVGDLSVASSSCIFPHMTSEINALSSMLSLSGYPNLFNGFPLISQIPYLNGALPPHATIESLGLINSALYHQQRDVQSAMGSPNSSQISTFVDTRPRAFSSAATLQHAKPPQESEKRRKRCRKMPESNLNTTTTITCTTQSATSTTSSSMPPTTSVLRSLVEDDDGDITTYPNKVRPIHVTKEEEEMVRRKTEEILKTVPIHPADSFSKSSSGPLRRLIRDEDLPDEVGPDSPFRHYPKYQRKPPTQLVMMKGIQAAVAALCIEAFQIEEKSEEEQNRNKHRKSLDDTVAETVRQELIAAE